MTTRSDHTIDMVNIRRVGLSLVVGLLILTGAMVQASAAEVDDGALAATQRGFELALQVGAELEEQRETGAIDAPGVARSLEVLEAIVERFNEERERNGRGPQRAVEVHQALLEGRSPSRSGGADGPLGNAFGLWKKQFEDGRPGNAPAVPPGQAKKLDDRALPPGQAKKLPPHQRDDRALPPGQARKRDDRGEGRDRPPHARGRGDDDRRRGRQGAFSDRPVEPQW